MPDLHRWCAARRRRPTRAHVFSVDAAQSLAGRESQQMDSWSAAFLFMTTLVRKLLNLLPFSLPCLLACLPWRVADAPWRAPLCTPLERGWVELWDIETARFSVASCDA